jgi:hypothetical protein
MSDSKFWHHSWLGLTDIYGWREVSRVLRRHHPASLIHTTRRGSLPRESTPDFSVDGVESGSFTKSIMSATI